MARARWVRTGAELAAYLWADPTGAVPAAEPEDAPFTWHARPPALATDPPMLVPSAVSMRVSRREAEDGHELATIYFGARLAGWEMFPAVLAYGRPRFAVSGVPSECDLVDSWQPALFVIDDVGAGRVIDSGEICGGHNDGMVLTPWLVTLHDGTLAALFRLGDNPDSAWVHYLRLDPDLAPIGRPVRVGRSRHNYHYGGGFQPRAATIGADRLVFSERADDFEFHCPLLTRMRTDGSSSEANPWQFECATDTYHVTRSHDLLPLEDGLAVAVWAERHSTPYVTSLHDGIWFERINLAMLGPEGRRASEVVRVTSDASTMLDATPRTTTSGPFSDDFVAAVDTFGNDVVIAWVDRRADAPGIYGRRFTCERDPAP